MSKKHKVTCLKHAGRQLVGNSVQTFFHFQLSRGCGHTGAKTPARSVIVGIVQNVSLNDMRHGVTVYPRTHATQERNGGGVSGAVARRRTGLGIFWNQNRIDAGDIGMRSTQWRCSDARAGVAVVGRGVHLSLEVLEGGVQQGVHVVHDVSSRWSGLRVAIQTLLYQSSVLRQ